MSISVCSECHRHFIKTRNTRFGKCSSCKRKFDESYVVGANRYGTGMNRHFEIHCEMRRLRGLDCNLCD